ncbi:hypothetical protein CAPTEDRAFT_196650 [Capitella teleta]|uniref:LRRCT domain-containing protein n=1 Tax=Capitella teleta TaxID=283909 RepID=R7TS38_CAPTE|nr:hypothetical protein CAPTEDRAFT_196650 [Capitella teleta]|eukprot:ELT96738.1 hypothetical protein CAPTEDRAFT_196650 [Capitella teleta]
MLTRVLIFLLIALPKSNCKHIVDLSNGRLEDTESFSTLEDLPQETTYLILSKNNITAVDIFPVSPNLEDLNLRYNSLTEFPQMINVSGTLERLLLTQNNIMHIKPERLACLSHLISLDLKENNLHHFPDVAGLNEFANLDLLRNNFTEFPELKNIGQTLIQLILGYNKITNLDSLTLMPEINSINLESNSFAIDSCFLHFFPIVTSVNFGSNTINVWPDFSNATRITNLILSQCELRQVPTSSLAHLPLESLIISHNKIDWQHVEDIYIPTLAILDMKSGILEVIPRWKNLSKSLKILRLGGNRILTLEDSDLDNYHALTELHLSNNLITSMPYLWNNGMKLTILNLSKNLITSVTLKQLEPIRNCTSLSLNGNKMKDLPNICLADFVMTVTIQIASNPFHCSASLLQAWHNSPAGNFTFVTDGSEYCSSPLDLSGRSLANIGFDEVTNEQHISNGTAYKYKRFSPSPHCLQPITVVHANVSLVGCAVLCLSVRNCLRIGHSSTLTGQLCAITSTMTEPKDPRHHFHWYQMVPEAEIGSP